MIVPVTVHCMNGEYYPHIWSTHLDGIHWKFLFRMFTINHIHRITDIRSIDISYKDLPTRSKEDVIRLAKEAARRWNKSHKVSYKLIIITSDQFFSIQRVEKTPEERAKELREWSGWGL